MLVAVACLEEGLITPSTRLSCGGAYYYGNRSMACHGAHGSITVERAIQASCNVFFAQCGMKLGPELMKKWGDRFGFGHKTHADITEEARGLVPSKEFMDKRWGERGWSKYAAANWGIGQGEILATPLQMARYTAVLANGGTLFQPHAVRAIQNKVLGRKEWIPYDSVDLQISQKTMDIVRRGMYLVVNQPGGTAQNVRLGNTVVCGKTGTAENPHGKDHSWFVGFAPMDNPTIAVCAMVENAGFGSTVAAPIVRDVVDLYLNKKWPAGMEPDEYELEDPDLERDTVSIPEAIDTLRGPFVTVPWPKTKRSKPVISTSEAATPTAVAQAPSSASQRSSPPSRSADPPPVLTPASTPPATPQQNVVPNPPPGAGPSDGGDDE